MTTDRSAESGFGLIEVIVCVALLVAGSVLALALLPAIVRASQAQLLREAATGIARNAIERARAAAAYAPPAAVATGSHAWALRPSASYPSAIRVRRALCGAPGPATDVPAAVELAYDAATDTLDVAVRYPPDPCRPGRLATVALAAVLAPPAYAPQTRIPASIADPAQQ